MICVFYFAIKGTIRYSAPEILQAKTPQFSCDIYSFGIMMWQLKENEIPYQTIQSNEIILWQVVKNNLRPDSALLLLHHVDDNSVLGKANSKLFCQSDLTTNSNNILKDTSLKRTSTPLSIIKKPSAPFKLLSSSQNSKNAKLERIDCKSLDLLVDIDNEENDADVSINKFLNLLLNDQLSDHFSLLHEKIFELENEYIKLYKACWHKKQSVRPRIESIYILLKNYIDCISN